MCLCSFKRLLNATFTQSLHDMVSYPGATVSTIHSAWRKASDRVLRRRIIDTATPLYGNSIMGHATEEETVSAYCWTGCQAVFLRTLYLVSVHLILLIDLNKLE